MSTHLTDAQSVAQQSVAQQRVAQQIRAMPLWPVGKYLLPSDLWFPKLRSSPSATSELGIAEIAARHPDRVKLHQVGQAESLPRYDYQCYSTDFEETDCVTAAVAPAAWVAELDQGVSYGRHCTVIGPGDEAVKETGFNVFGPPPPRAKWWEKLGLRYYRHRWQSDLTSRRRLPLRRHLPASVAPLNMRCSHNFYHWLIEILPRVATLRRAGLEADYYLVDCRSKFQQRVLSALGIGPERLIQPHCTLTLQADRLLVPSYPSPDCLRWLGQMLCEGLGVESTSQNAHADGGRRLFISRRQAATRRLRNEDEVESHLNERGFETHCFEDYDLQRQCQLIREADTVVATHGAGLANLIFASHGTKVIEIMPEGRYNPGCYPELSRVFGLQHQMIYAKRARTKQILDVPMEGLERALTSLEQPRAAA